MIILTIIFLPIAVAFTYIVAYAEAYPLSQTGAHVGDHHTSFQAARWILSIVSSFCFLAWFKTGIFLADKQWCCGLLICLSAMVLGTLPYWVQIPLEVHLLDRAWNSGCDGWAIDAVLNASAIVGFNVSLGVAAVAISPLSNYSMQLIAFSPEMYSFSVINSFNYTPPITYIVYNNETHIFTADNATNGNYTVAPQLSFPSLNLESVAPPYVNFQSESGPPSAWLSYNRSLDVLYTVNTYGQNATLLKVCGSLQRAEDFQIALGAVFIQHQLDTLYQGGWPTGLIWLGGD